MVCLLVYLVTILVESVNWHLPSYIATACIIYAMNLTVDPDQRELTRLTSCRFQEILHLERVSSPIFSDPSQYFLT